eukprot:TRINITY_DN13107_c0_g2_i2.p1 TRINITY_DN13107_c0_g2~~TRINITY_DN13107_c0_g2_i2.p1  ORF type:complete len:1860 (-),score=285.54 TRINITY_DN13107_c0_g2_i2:125-5278(-)
MSGLNRLLSHASESDTFQSAELIAEEGDQTQVYESKCHKDVHLILGPCNLAVPNQRTPKYLRLLRVYAFGGPGQQKRARRAALSFLSSSPVVQQPWHVFGTVPVHAADQAGKRHASDSELKHDALPANIAGTRSKARPGLTMLDGGELRRAVDPSRVRHFLELVGGDKLTDQEKSAGSAEGNALLVGRSGTGKTTVAMLRLAALDLLRAPTEASMQTVFLTASPVLSHEVLRGFQAIRRLPGIRTKLRRAGLITVPATAGRSSFEAGRQFPSHRSSAGNLATHVTSNACQSARSVANVDLAQPREANDGLAPSSLGSWLAFEVDPTEKSFEMVDAEVFDVATLKTDESVDIEDAIDEETSQNGRDLLPQADQELTDDESLQSQASDDDQDDVGSWAPLAPSRLPPALSVATPEDFPMFLTVRHLLHMLDASLSRPFFARDANKRVVDADVCTWQPEGGGAGLLSDWMGGAKWQPGAAGESNGDVELAVDFDDGADDLLRSQCEEPRKSERSDPKITEQPKGQPARRMEVGFDYFSEVMWPSMKQATELASQGFHPSVVWTEIMAHIKGSKEALDNDRPLTVQEYVENIGRKRTPMTVDQRGKVYSIYAQYEKLKAALSAYDEADFVRHLHQHLKAEGYAGPRIRCLVVDEVQDISQATLRLILELVEPQRGGLLLCGDPAQTISKGLAFRLCDLQSAFLEGATLSRHPMPEVMRLTTNFRSTAPVLRLANDVLSILRAFFPNAIDHGGEETAAGKGEGPSPLRATSLQELVMEITGGQPGSKAAFGADVVVLVREQAQKEALPELLRHCLVMTVWEAKGLEFDTVVLYGFFATAQADWSFFAKGARSPPDSFAVEMNALLCCELKQLYVAITRAKRQVFFFDEPPHAGCRQLWSSDFVRDIEPTTTEERTHAATGTSAEAWRAQGQRLLRLGFAAQAKLCFSMSGDELLRLEAEATSIAKQASIERARCQVHVAQRALAQKDGDVADVESAQQTDGTAVSEQFRYAADLFKQCEKPAHAGKCLVAVQEWTEAAKCFRAAQRWNEAAISLLHAGSFSEAAESFELAGQWVHALAAWKKADLPQELLRAAHTALQGHSGGRDAILGYVRGTLEALPDARAIREAARLLGAPDDDDRIPEYVADQLEAESVALRLTPLEDPNRVPYYFRAFHRCVLQKQDVSHLVNAAAKERCALATVLYGLAPRAEALVDVDSPFGKGFDLWNLKYAVVPKSSTLVLKHTIALGDSLMAASCADVCRAHRMAQQVDQAEDIVRSGIGGDSLQALTHVVSVPGVAKSTIRKFASRFAKDMWMERGPLGPAQPLGANMIGALLTAALETWEGPDARDGRVEQTFAICCASGRKGLDVFTELQGAQHHRRLVDFACCLQSGAITDASKALLEYMESSDSSDISFAFIGTLASYIAGPATVMLQPPDGAYVLTSLVWDWPQGIEHHGAREVFASLRAEIEDRQLDPEMERKGKPSSALPKRSKAKDAPKPQFNEVFTDECRERKAAITSRWAVEVVQAGNATLCEALVAQLSYALGDGIDEEWWSEAWSDEFPASMPSSSLAASAKAQMSEDRTRRNRRRAAGCRIASWAAAQWRLRTEHGKWSVMRMIADAIRAMRLTPVSEAAQLTMAAESFVRGTMSAVAVRTLAREALAREAELQRRSEGARCREEIERTRHARELAEAERRRRVQKKQARLDKKAEEAKLMKRLSRNR